MISGGSFTAVTEIAKFWISYREFSSSPSLAWIDIFPELRTPSRGVQVIKPEYWLISIPSGDSSNEK